MSNLSKLAELGMPTGLAKEVVSQIGGALGENAAVAALTAIATADATDAATTQAMANQCKAKINSIIAALKS